MSVLRGLLGTEAYASQRFTSIRRRVFYQYPAGAAPLIGLLSMINTDKPLNDPEFTIFEKRFVERSTRSVLFSASHGPFGDSGGTVLSSGAGNNLVAATEYQIKVTSTENFRVDNTIRIKGVLQQADTSPRLTFDIIGRVTAVVDSTHLKFASLKAYALVSNESGVNLNLEVMAIGSSYGQGATGSTEAGLVLPASVSNAAQIWRTAFSFTRTELKTGGLKFDESGIYKSRAKEAALEHMIDLEMSLFFGVYSKAVDGTSGLPKYTTRGLVEFLQLWEAGTTYGNTAATANTDDNKRILDINGAITYSAYDGYLERVFRVCNNMANEKLVLCGNGFLQTVNRLYEGRSITTVDMPNKASVFGADIIGHKTPFGTVWYKTHPLFNQNPYLRNDAFFLDVPNILYRPVQDSDTTRLTNRGARDFDGRKDEYLTEAGFECRFPESHMWMRGVSGVLPG